MANSTEKDTVFTPVFEFPRPWGVACSTRCGLFLAELRLLRNVFQGKNKLMPRDVCKHMSLYGGLYKDPRKLYFAGLNKRQTKDRLKEDATQ